MLFYFNTFMMKYISIIILSCLIFFSCSSKKKTVNSKTPTELSKADTGPKIGEIVALKSGLKYKIIKRGTGTSPTMNSKVRAHYHGTLEDGKVFDSSIDKGKPLVFTLNQVIKGWQEGLQLMKEGGVWELYIPTNLGYGASGRPGIPPFSNLTFRVELLEVL